MKKKDTYTINTKNNALEFTFGIKFITHIKNKSTFHFIIINQE